VLVEDGSLVVSERVEDVSGGQDVDARRWNERRARALERVTPKPVERSAIDTAVKSANSPSAATASGRLWIPARSRTPTPALPPVPCRSPIAYAWSGERARIVCPWAGSWRAPFPSNTVLLARVEASDGARSPSGRPPRGFPALSNTVLLGL
jgi:hypothetical protein